LIDEVHVPGRPAKLTVGRGLQTEFFLKGDDRANGTVLDFTQCVAVDSSLGEVLSCLQQFRWAKKTADVVGTKWWG
jgi:hypothetical protein